MLHFQSLVAVVLCLSSTTALLVENQIPDTVFECGQTLQVSSSARIEYHVSATVGTYGICPWIIRFENAASLKFELEANGFDAFTKVTVATVDITSSSPYSTLLHSQDLGGVHATTVVTLPGTVAIIVLSTSPEYNGPFVLNVTKMSESALTLSRNSVDRISAKDSGYLLHPAGGGNYDNHELSTFLMAPSNYTSNCIAYGCTWLKYYERGLEHGCFDRVDVFHFIRDFSGGWMHSSVLCGGESVNYFLNLGELALVTFGTDRVGTGRGFGLRFFTNKFPEAKL